MKFSTLCLIACADGRCKVCSFDRMRGGAWCRHHPVKKI
ncbi:hypothetical protein RTCIAT899_CH14980 [Rhizobium tropici CIAT 899]|nr:hypothetical protein RTCIAT899_CH14980 [Rhizobium tropici CIAT 899]